MEKPAHGERKNTDWRNTKITMKRSPINIPPTENWPGHSPWATNNSQPNLGFGSILCASARG